MHLVNTNFFLILNHIIKLIYKYLLNSKNNKLPETFVLLAQEASDCLKQCAVAPGNHNCICVFCIKNWHEGFHLALVFRLRRHIYLFVIWQNIWINRDLENGTVYFLKFKWLNYNSKLQPDRVKIKVIILMIIIS